MTGLEFHIEGLRCQCFKAEGNNHVAYLLYPMSISAEWIATAPERYDTSIVVITGMDWDDDLTPWPAKGVPTGAPDFKGDAPAFLARLNNVVETVERNLSLPSLMERTLVGVSLSGLFALWQWTQCTTFDNIASLSGSFWYDGFADWIEKQDFSAHKGFAYFLLGDMESKTSVKAFKTVGIDTGKVVSKLKDSGIRTEYEVVPGNHYQYPVERLDKAFKYIKYNLH